MEKKKKIIVTGASGFVGRNFIEKYSDRYDIVPISLRTTEVRDIDFTGVDCVLHLAALVHQMKGAPEEKYFEINRDLTKRLAIRAKKSGVRHFVFYSTVKVYGYDGDLYNHSFILDENSKCKPNDPYGKSKYEAEEILRKLEDNNFTVAHIRPPMIYGPGVKGNMESLIKLVDKMPVLPFNYDSNKRSIVFIKNLLTTTDKIISQKEKGIFIPQDEKIISIKELIEAIAEGLGKKRILVKFPDFVFKLLYKIKPSIMLRLYGSLQFKNKKKVEPQSTSNFKYIIDQKVKKRVIVLTYGNGGHKAQMERLVKLIKRENLIDTIKLVGICEKNYPIKELIFENYELPILSDKTSRKRTIKMFIINMIKYIYVCNKINKKYDVRGVVSTGPSISLIPSIFFKLKRKKIVFIEDWCKFEVGTLTGKIIYKIANKFYIQNQELRKKYPNSIYKGKL